jgi:hypothetical protein
MNRLKIRHLGDYVQAIKPGISQVMTLGACDNSFIQRSIQTNQVELMAWVKFDELNFDGVHVIVQAMRDGQKVSTSLPTAKLFYIDQGASWAKTEITEKPLSQDGAAWVVSYFASELPELLANRTLLLEVKAQRLGKTLRFAGYFNHLGALEFMTRNKKKITFIELTKVDE